MFRIGIALLLTTLCLINSGYIPNKEKTSIGPKIFLSEYGFFEGDMALQQPAEGVVPYELAFPLFSDYAEKLRFVKIPKGQKVRYRDPEVFDFPIGTTIIKTFYYPKDFRKPEKGRQLMETRLLVREEAGWKAIPYVWNEAQTDAELEVAGDRKKISWIHANGKKQKLEYVVPNLNQCKGCHNLDETLTPIGPTARQLNHEFSYTEGAENQLAYWQQKGILEGMPAVVENIPQVPQKKVAHSGDLNSRARAWLDVNCAHCHNPKGPGNTSGLFLEYHQQDSAKLGFFKAPVAAGKGSGTGVYDIEPGNAEGSILLYRIRSLDPGEMMPELGRKLQDKEGVELIRKWIDAMES